MTITELLLALLPAALALLMLSFLYRDNIFFAFGEHTIVGIAVGLELVGGYRSIMAVGVMPIFQGKTPEVAVPAMILGVMAIARMRKSVRWVSNISICLLIGVGLGLATRGAVVGQFVDQIRATMLPITTRDMMTNLNNLILIIGTMSATLFFIFTKKQKGVLGGFSEIGRYFIMIAMGATMATNALTFTSPAIGSAFDLGTSPGIYLSAIAVAMLLFDIYRRREKRTGTETQVDQSKLATKER